MRRVRDGPETVGTSIRARVAEMPSPGSVCRTPMRAKRQVTTRLVTSIVSALWGREAVSGKCEGAQERGGSVSLIVRRRLCVLSWY